MVDLAEKRPSLRKRCPHPSLFPGNKRRDALVQFEVPLILELLVSRRLIRKVYVLLGEDDFDIDEEEGVGSN